MKRRGNLQPWSFARLATLLAVSMALLVWISLQASAASAQSCPNAAYRSGPSAALPDCRAYELVSPADASGRALGFGLGNSVQGTLFPTALSTDIGDGFLVETAGTPLAEPMGANGARDMYEAVRTLGGWQTQRLLTPSGEELGESTMTPGGVSLASQLGTVTITSGSGSLGGEPGVASTYLQRPSASPNGSYELVGIGSLGVERHVEVKWISPHGEHVIFTDSGPQVSEGNEKKQLEPDAPPTGTPAIYDRSALGGPTHVVSLLPGNVTPSQGATYQGASENGSVVAFKVAGSMYTRIDNSSTVQVSDAALGEALTCVAGPSSATLDYEWLRNGTPIGGQTTSTYTTAAADEGKAIQCRVTATTSEGGSRATSAPKTVEPASVVAAPGQGNVNAAGTAAVGQTLTCTTAGWTGGPAFSYQWLRNGAPIGGQTAETYLLAGADNEKAIQCEVTATNAGAAAVGDSPPKVIRSEPPVNTGTSANAPAITGTATIGETLTCSNGAWTGTGISFAYQWLRNGAEITAAAASTYTLVAADEGKAVQCRVTATGPGGSGVAISTNEVIAPNPTPLPPTRPSGALSVTGTRNIGQTLSCAAGTWGNSPTSFAFQWLRNGTEIAAATTSTYTLVAADLDKLIQCRVTATNAGGSSAGSSPATQANVVVINPPSAAASSGGGSQTFAGLTSDGSHMFFVEGGDAFDFDTATASVRRITSVGDAELVNVSSDGSHVYFISHKQIGGEGTAGQPNLYVWEVGGAETTFIATVLPGDLSGPLALGNWASRVVNGELSLFLSGPGYNASRTTPDGTVLAFESAAELTGYENAGQREVYRYDSESEELACASCNPTAEPATFGARFEEPASLISQVIVNNLSEDGSRVFFETEEALVSGDIDNNNDIYEWSEEGGEPTLALISSGQTPAFPMEGGVASRANQIGAITPSGDDVFFLTLDALTPGVRPGDAAIYDARVGGGFDESVAPPCSGEGCQPASSAPALPGESVAASATYSGRGNVPKAKKPPKKHHKQKHKRHRKARRAQNGSTGGVR
jgi:hypothetical protein